MKLFRIEGRYDYQETRTKSVRIDTMIIADDKESAEEQAISNAVDASVSIHSNDVEELDRQIEVTDCGEAPTDQTVWMLPRSLAPTLFPLEECGGQ